ncbi:hypothetical protein OG585_41555 [Streptomyces sp. NBC_01340]|uniref:hypothetical protein n=1 Tax=unclassified Streptomyces TaxID=2593676 RepID=UPI00224E4378|nr:MULTISPECIES: hypothetical protein [unclassified Streptomyces]MCX4459234.1 hypothetical protein [Streptomyces sp. NBC_01719]MCX4498591.1 hypothetical protein [Streptomyces sp. NBC_01728]MCX4595510.1 hypothetical protein [Streptomyces sp. NBC_01549]WSI44587.1 hypothetical protein OG585_41555 [Streptomyces sp. NBC_01340]
MTAGSVLGVPSIIIADTTPNVGVFAVGWQLVSSSMAAASHQPVFAALTGWWKPDHIRAAAVVTSASGSRLRRLRDPSSRCSRTTCSGA